MLLPGFSCPRLCLALTSLPSSLPPRIMVSPQQSLFLSPCLPLSSTSPAGTSFCAGHFSSTSVFSLLFHLNLLTFGSFWAPSPSNTLRGPCTNSKPLSPCCRDGQGGPGPSWISAGCQGRLQEGNVDFGVHHTQSRSHRPLCCLLHRQSCPLTF